MKKQTLHNSILMYTIHDDSMRNCFLNSVKENFKNILQINESTYALQSKNIDAITAKIESIYYACREECGLTTTSQKDMVSVLCAVMLKNQSYPQQAQEQIIEYHII